MNKLIISFIVIAVSIASSFAAGNKIFLDNVAEWEFIAGVTIQQSTFGQANGTYSEETWTYSVTAEFFSLPTLQGGYYYQGWVFDSAARDYIPAGQITFSSSITQTRVNEKLSFSAQKDLRNYTEYALSIEAGNIWSITQENIILLWDMEFNIIRSRDTVNQVTPSNSKTDEEKLAELKEKASTISSQTNFIPKTTTAVSANSIFGATLTTDQQEVLATKLWKISQTRLLQIKAVLPTARNTLRDKDITVQERSTLLVLLNDVEIVINYLTK